MVKWSFKQPSNNSPQGSMQIKPHHVVVDNSFGKSWFEKALGLSKSGGKSKRRKKSSRKTKSRKTRRR